MDLLFLIVGVSIPTAVGYVLGRRFTPAWLGLVLALLWLPVLLIVVPQTARLTVFVVILWSFIPTVTGFSVGVAKRPLKPGQGR